MTSSKLDYVPLVTVLRHPLYGHCTCTVAFLFFFLLIHMFLASLSNCYTRAYESINKVMRCGNFCFCHACEFCCTVVEGVSFLLRNVKINVYSWQMHVCCCFFFLSFFFSLSSRHLLTLFTYSILFTSGYRSSTEYTFLLLPHFFSNGVDVYHFSDLSCTLRWKLQITALRLFQKSS